MLEVSWKGLVKEGEGEGVVMGWEVAAGALEGSGRLRFCRLYLGRCSRPLGG